MKPIWYFVGLILFVIGLILLVTGLYSLATGTQGNAILSELYPDIWWGAIMAVVGLIYIIKNRKVIVE